MIEQKSDAGISCIERTEMDVSKLAEKVALDAGHGGRDYGAVYENRREKDDNLKLVQDVGDVLEQNGVDVMYTRTSDVYHTPYERAMAANNEGADYFVSLHRNAFPEPNQASGVESFIYRQGGDGEKMAKAINENMESLGFVNRGVEERPNLVVLKRTQMPAVLVQAGYLDSLEDNRLFDNNYEGIVQAIAQGILDSILSQQPYYKVQVGVFRMESNARKLLEELVGEGFPAYVVFEDGYYKVFAGAFREMDDAVDLEKRLRENGYATVLVKN